MMNDNNFPQNNNGFNNSQNDQPQWNNGYNNQPPVYPNGYGYNGGGRSNVMIMLVVLIIILLVALCLLGGYLLGKRGKQGAAETNNSGLSAELATTVAAVTAEATVPPTEAPVTQPAVTQEIPTTEEATKQIVVQKEEDKTPKTVIVGSKLYDVRVATKSTDLNLRETPSSSGKVIASIPKGTVIPYYGSEGNWGIVQYNGKTGYVSIDYIVRDAGMVYYGPSGYLGYGTITAKSGLNLRSDSSTSASVVTLIPYGAEVEIWSNYGGWYYVDYGQYSGYVSAEYVNAYFY